MLFIEIVKFLILVASCQAMTMKQLRNTGKMMRKSCQPKNNVEDEKIDSIGDGVFIDEKEVKCYIACIMKMANTIKNGKLNLEAALKQADLLLPEEIKEPAKEAITACRKVGVMLCRHKVLETSPCKVDYYYIIIILAYMGVPVTFKTIIFCVDVTNESVSTHATSELQKDVKSKSHSGRTQGYLRRIISYH